MQSYGMLSIRRPAAASTPRISTNLHISVDKDSEEDSDEYSDKGEGGWLLACFLLSKGDCDLEGDEPLKDERMLERGEPG